VVARPLEALVRSGVLGMGPRVVLDIDDLDSEVLQQRLGGGIRTLPRAVDAALIRRLRTIEARTFAACDRLWLASEDDQRRHSWPHCTLLPNAPWWPEGRPPYLPRPARPDSLVVLFVGNLHYEPNTEGVAAFIREAWPQVRAAFPAAVLRLVGPSPPPSVEREWRRSPGVEVTGFAEDLTPVYDDAALTIAPLTWGGGTCIKVLESLAHARPCVLTARTLLGFQSFLRHGESVWCAGDVAAMAEGCVRLLGDAALRQAMAERGRHAVEQHAGMPRFTAIVARTLAAVTSRPGTVAP
jgi:glycosyltransferase involved in cell wall biosynthesis